MGPTETRSNAVKINIVLISGGIVIYLSNFDDIGTSIYY